jgi:hypothetical protein
MKEAKVGFCSLFRFASRKETLLMVIGGIGSVLMGCGLPIFANLTGNIIDAFAAGNAF